MVGSIRRSHLVGMLYLVQSGCHGKSEDCVKLSSDNWLATMHNLGNCSKVVPLCFPQADS